MTQAEELLPAYSRELGIFVDRFDGMVPVLGCDFSETTLGRAGFWHGGALSGLLDMAAVSAVRASLGISGGQLKLVNITVQFLRGAGTARTFAKAKIVRAGRRLVNVTAEAWQEERLLATAQFHVSIEAEASKAGKPL